ncbi:MAG: coproporphyrinogen dehydrogenase HemZ [Peptococcaceae bacterium]|nr:coproporphyrinogen dehydrogenase HemZ [Peptococcaceae bacterium]
MASEVYGPPVLVAAVKDLMRIVPASSQLRVEFGPVPATAGVISCVVNQEFTVNVNTTSNELRQIKHAARRALVGALNLALPWLSLPWGTLTGIRPTKIVHRLLDQGLSPQVIVQCLRAEYLIRPDKAELVLEVALRQRKYLLTPEAAQRSVSVYVGIPFCPTRCLYCSFPSYIGNLPRLQTYLSVVEQEIAALGGALQERDIQVQTLYVGGGTPTMLDPAQLSELLESCCRHIVTAATQEFTVEAGRPDTINAANLQLMADYGVTRVSINPQSMRAHTLQAMGRDHTPEQVKKSFALARSLGFTQINMDIIMGLPGEDREDVAYTLQELCSLDPDNLTVHALALKRAATLRQEVEALALPSAQVAEAMQELVQGAARDMGMEPYYLYRQKQIFGNLENVGYAKPGKESIYNIQIMAERQSILAVGAGGASKLVKPGEWSLCNFQHPKQPEAYYARWRQDLTRVLTMLDEFTLAPIDKTAYNAYNYDET